MNKEQQDSLTCVQQYMIDKHGLLMSGKTLWCALGFENSQSFRKARSQGRIGVEVFSIPKRRGSFALTVDVASWIENLNKQEEEEM